MKETHVLIRTRCNLDFLNALPQSLRKYLTLISPLNYPYPQLSKHFCLVSAMIHARSLETY